MHTILRPSIAGNEPPEMENSSLRKQLRGQTLPDLFGESQPLWCRDMVHGRSRKTYYKFHNWLTCTYLQLSIVNMQMRSRTLFILPHDAQSGPLPPSKMHRYVLHHPLVFKTSKLEEVQHVEKAPSFSLPNPSNMDNCLSKMGCLRFRLEKASTSLLLACCTHVR